MVFRVLRMMQDTWYRPTTGASGSSRSAATSTCSA